MTPRMDKIDTADPVPDYSQDLQNSRLADMHFTTLLFPALVAAIPAAVKSTLPDPTQVQIESVSPLRFNLPPISEIQPIVIPGHCMLTFYPIGHLWRYWMSPG